MDLMELARRDMQHITGAAGGFNPELTFVGRGASPDTATIRGLASRHHLSMDTMGNVVNTRNVHCSFSEDLLVAEGYTVRNAAGEVDLKNHKVTWADATGTQKTYKIDRWHPDDTLGLIVCILGEVE